jgi:hypothetical protein
VISVADPGSGVFVNPWSWIWSRLFPDLGSRIPPQIFGELSQNFLGKNHILCKLAEIFFFTSSKVYNFFIIMATKKGRQQIPPPLFVAVVKKYFKIAGSFDT